jgi:tRNA (guanine37-N1)-methyltransferase
MRIDILTIFPTMFVSPFSETILKRAQEKGLVTINVRNIRDYATDKHKSTDDYPFGGGAGMVMKVDPIAAALEAALVEAQDQDTARTRRILLTPAGRVFNQRVAQELAQKEHIVLICGRYEGIDERVREHLVDDEISIGDYVLSGGEIPAMVVVDAVSRLVPGVLGAAESTQEESFAQGLLEYPQYTRPPEFNGWSVPDILLSGNHAAIARWRREQSLLRTLRQRPELLSEAELTETDLKYLRRVSEEEGIPLPIQLA